MKHKVKNIHFIGIGGVGMSGIAEVLHNLGYNVTGSDVAQSYNTDRLQSIGINIAIGHDVNYVRNADVVVTSTAINHNNPEIVFAKKHDIQIVPRAVMLAELMRFKYGIAIAGTHGKTTTTSLATEVLKECRMDPTFVIGGKLTTTGSNAKLGTGEYLVAEADESDASFLYLSPMISVVTNIDLDHMETYDHDENKLIQTFVTFLNRLPFYGRAILCVDNERVRNLIPQVKRPITTYGLDKTADIFATNIKAVGNTMQFDVNIPEDGVCYPIIVNMPGMHNVLNALAVIALALECDGRIKDIARGLANFQGVGRRTQHYPEVKYNGKTMLLIDDYGHHPTEVEVTLAAINGAYPDKTKLVIFQPHRYSRTRDLFQDFIKALSITDRLILCEVYSAGEEPIVGATSMDLKKALELAGHKEVYFVKTIEEARDKALEVVNDGEIIITMGAGNVGKLPPLFYK